MNAAISKTVGQAFFGRFRDLRPLQVAAADVLSAGKNLMLSAGTGSGKTEAVTAPLISRYRREMLDNGSPAILYISPTKSLINDLAKRLSPPLDKLGLKLVMRHGDRNQADQVAEKHILLTTPESFCILITQKHPVLASIQAIVLDEVHLLYNNQRGLMVSLLIHRLSRALGRGLQVAGLSATVGDLGHLKDFVLGPGSEAECLAFPASRTIDGDVRSSTDESLVKISERLMKAPKRKLLIFVNKRIDAEIWGSELRSREDLADIVTVHHSSLSPDIRESTEKQFGEGLRGVCVSTSTLEMGIDIGDIDATILMSPPFSLESLLQRIGRGNRRSSKTNVICLSGDGKDSVAETALFSSMLFAASQGKMPAHGCHSLYGAVAQQCLVIVVQNEGGFTRVADIVEELSFRHDLDRSLIEEILEQLVECELLQKHGFQNRYGATEDLWELRDTQRLWGNFPLASQTIDVKASGLMIANIPRVNLMHLRVSDHILLAGRRFRILSIRDDEIQVGNAPASGPCSLVKFSGGMKSSIDSFLAGNIWHWLFEVDQAVSYMGAVEWEKTVSFLKKVRKNIGVDSVPVCRTDRGYRYYTFAGADVNRVLAIRYHGLVDLSDGFAFETLQKVSFSDLPTKTSELLEESITSFQTSDHQTIFQQMLPVRLQVEEWKQRWMKNKDAGRCLERLSTSGLVSTPEAIIKPFFS